MLDLLGYLAGILIVISMLPQVIKNWREKSAKDISMIRSIIYVLGVFCYTLYGIGIKNGPITAMNIFGLILGISSLFLKIKYS